MIRKLFSLTLALIMSIVVTYTQWHICRAESVETDGETNVISPEQADSSDIDDETESESATEIDDSSNEGSGTENPSEQNESNDGETENTDNCEEELSANVTFKTVYAVVDRKPVECSVTVSGGASPYAVALTINGKTVEELTFTEGIQTFTYMPQYFGTCKTAVTVTDSCGKRVTTSRVIPVAVMDREYPADWDECVRDAVLCGEWDKDLVAIARTQLGYTESEVDFIINSSGEERHYTRYGEWYGAAYSKWCAMFVSFCLEYAGIPETYVPRNANCAQWLEMFQSMGVYAVRDEMLAANGDLVFFDMNGDGRSDHVGIVEKVTADGFDSIEGNVGGAVTREHHGSADSQVMGFASTITLMNQFYSEIP